MRTTMAAREGVGQKREQLTMTASTWAGATPDVARASVTVPLSTISASARAADSVGAGGEACMAGGRYVASPRPPAAAIFS